MVRDANKQSIQSYKINIMGALLSQMLGKGVHAGVSTVSGYDLGLPAVAYYSKGWSSTEATLGKAQEKVAKNCCESNFDGEVAATLADGILPQVSDGRVPIAASTDMH
jgi:hypothetical protein